MRTGARGGGASGEAAGAGRTGAGWGAATHSPGPFGTWTRSSPSPFRVCGERFTPNPPPTPPRCSPGWRPAPPVWFGARSLPRRWSPESGGGGEAKGRTRGVVHHRTRVSIYRSRDSGGLRRYAATPFSARPQRSPKRLAEPAPKGGASALKVRTRLRQGRQQRCRRHPGGVDRPTDRPSPRPAARPPSTAAAAVDALRQDRQNREVSAPRRRRPSRARRQRGARAGARGRGPRGGGGAGVPGPPPLGRAAGPPRRARGTPGPLGEGSPGGPGAPQGGGRGHSPGGHNRAGGGGLGVPSGYPAGFGRLFTNLMLGFSFESFAMFSSGPGAPAPGGEGRRVGDARKERRKEVVRGEGRKQEAAQAPARCTSAVPCSIPSLWTRRPGRRLSSLRPASCCCCWAQAQEGLERRGGTATSPPEAPTAAAALQGPRGRARGGGTGSPARGTARRGRSGGRTARNRGRGTGD